MPHNRILIADDHGIVRAGIKALVKQYFEADEVYEAANESQITKQVKAVFFDLVLLDINIPGSDFTGMMDWLKNTSPESNIIVFTSYPETIYGQRCLELGAKGFLNKTASNTQIMLAIKTVLSGIMYFNEQPQKNKAQLNNSQKKGNPFEQLSSRELEIALLISKGFTLPDICSALNIQYSTANTNKRRIFEKLHVHNAVLLSHLMQTFKMQE
jgi:two-component system invasion response regulator UvrY